MSTAAAPMVSEPVSQFIAKPRKMLIDGKWVDAASGKTFAQLTDDEKNTRSHRGRALVALKKKMREQGLIP